MSVLDFESITVSTNVKNIAAANIDQHHNFALIECETAAVRYRLDGTGPSSSVGHILNPGDVLELQGLAELSGFGAIRRDSTDATLRVSTGMRKAL